nr:DNA repair protein RecO [Acidimicrobiia bacterium]
LLKAAETIGVAPALDLCAGCGRRDGLTRFSFSAGGALCDHCRTPGAYALRDGLTTYLAELAAADLDEMPETRDEFSGEARGVARRFVEYHLERQIHSMAVLDV